MAEMYLYDTKVGQTCKKLPQFSEISGSKWKFFKNLLSRMCIRISCLYFSQHRHLMKVEKIYIFIWTL